MQSGFTLRVSVVGVACLLVSVACTPQQADRVKVTIPAERGGYVGDTFDTHEGKVAAQEEAIKIEEKRLDELKKEQEDAERQKYYNEHLKKYE